VDGLAQGIAGVLKETGTYFIGGDLGVAPSFRYTGSVIGRLEGTPLLRSGAKVGDGIFLTGQIGLGNVEAALKLYGENQLIKQLTRSWKNIFQLRYKEAEIIKKYSHCCIDTSDGVYNALQAVSEMSQTGFIVEDLPYLKSGLLLAKVLGVAKEILFLGECGEYELLFTLSKDSEEEFSQEAQEKKLSFQRIGEVTQQDTRMLREKDKEIDLRDYALKARDYTDPKEYLRKALEFLNR
jgi:thiamine-monophosphate kinase